MQAINITRTKPQRISSASPLPRGWWLAPALIVSIGLWFAIFQLVF